MIDGRSTRHTHGCYDTYVWQLQLAVQDWFYALGHAWATAHPLIGLGSVTS